MSNKNNQQYECHEASALASAKNKINETAGKISETAGQVKDNVADMYNQAACEVKKCSAESMHALECYVKENPLKSIGVSLLTGALLMLLIKH